MRYEQSDRGPMMWLAITAFVAFAAFAYVTSAPIYALVPVLLGLALLIVAFVNGAKHGSEVSGAKLTVWSGDETKVFKGSQIAKLTVDDWSDSSDWAVHLTDGTIVELPTQALPPRRQLHIFANQLGVPLDNS